MPAAGAPVEQSRTGLSQWPYRQCYSQKAAASTCASQRSDSSPDKSVRSLGLCESRTDSSVCNERIAQFVCLSVCLSVSVSLSLSLCLYVYVSLSLSTCLLSVSDCVCLSVSEKKQKVDNRRCTPVLCLPL